MNLQLIKYKPFKFCLNGKQFEFVKPKYLMPVGQLRLIEAKIKGSTMVFYIENETVSYNQIRSLELCVEKKQ